MGFFGLTKAEVVEEKLVQLLDRLFGRSNVHCMNIQSGSGGLLADLRSKFREDFGNMERKMDELEEEIKELKKPKTKKKTTKKRK